MEALNGFQKSAAVKTVPWFLENMPPAYFRAINEKERLQHLNAITALVNAQQPEVMLRSPEDKVYSYIRSGANYPGLLANVIDQLPKNIDGAELARVKIFTSLDDTLGVDIFRFGKQGASFSLILLLLPLLLGLRHPCSHHLLLLFHSTRAVQGPEPRGEERA